MLQESEESPHDRLSNGLSSGGGFTLAVQAFDQAIAELADEVLSRCPDGKASVEACLRQRCARLVDQQLEAFREHADRREQHHLARREERNEAVRKTLQLVEQQHQEALQVTAARHLEGLQAATAVARSEAAAEAAAIAEKRMEAKLSEASAATTAKLESTLAEAAAAAAKKLDARLQEAAATAQDEIDRRTREAAAQAAAAAREEVEQRAREAAVQASAVAATQLREASAAAAAKLSEVTARARHNHLEVVSTTMARSEVWHIGSSAHLVFLLWRSSSKSCRTSVTTDAREPKIAEKIDDRIDTKGSLMKHIYSDKSSSENEPPRNGQAFSHPQGPPPAHQPTRPVLRSVRSDGSMTPARPGTAPLVEPPPTITQPLAPATGLLPHAQGAASPSIVCRVDGARQPYLGENAGTHQRSTGSLPPATGDVAVWGAAVRAQSTERQPTYRQASPTPRSRPPALASPGVPLAPPHLQQALAVGQQTPTTAGYRAVQAPPAAYGSGTVGRSVTPRSQPPNCAVQMMSTPAAAWQASGPGLVASTPRGLSPCPFVEVPKQQGSGSFVAVAPPVGQPKQQGSGSFVAAPPAHKPSTVHGFATGTCPLRAASGPTSSAPPGPLATQPALSQLQSPPPGSSQVARLRQGSPLSRSRTVDWNAQPSAQAYVRPHAAWGHM